MLSAAVYARISADTEGKSRGGALRQRWDSLTLDRQHAIVRAVLDYAVIAPGTPGAHTLDINRVQPRWRI